MSADSARGLGKLTHTLALHYLPVHGQTAGDRVGRSKEVIPFGNTATLLLARSIASRRPYSRLEPFRAETSANLKSSCDACGPHMP
jgi:hypothetical protein